MSLRIDSLQDLSTITSETSGYSLSGDYPIQIFDISCQGQTDIIYCQLQFLVRKDYLDVPADELIIDENNQGITDYFNRKISVNSEYNLYLYNGESLQITPYENRLEPVISLNNIDFMFGWVIQKV